MISPESAARISRLRSELVAGERDPQAIIAEIRAVEDAETIAAAVEARAECARLQAEIERMKSPIKSWQDELDDAYSKLDETSAAAEKARKEHETAVERVAWLEHQIKDAERRAQIAEVKLSEFQANARAAIATQLA